MTKFPHYKQINLKDCGPTCIKVVAKHYGKSLRMQQLRELSETTRNGSSMLRLGEAAEKIGFHTLGVKIDYERLQEAPLPAIIHWNENHFVVLYKIKSKKKLFPFSKNGNGDSTSVYVSDPAHGLLHYSQKDFIKSWIGEDKKAIGPDNKGYALLMEPTPKFYKDELEEEAESFNFRFVSRYVLKYKRFIFQLIIGLLAGSLLQLFLPFLTQSIVDVGIKNQDIRFVYLILMAQLFLFAGKTALEIIRSWILLHLSTRINISLISDFFIKLMNLPISFFDTRMTGDILQRINDHQRIERILTTSSLNVLFSFVNLIIFGFVLAYYSMQIFAIFLIGSLLYFIWVLFFFKRRKELDYKRFAEIGQEQSKVIELINGMQEIKLHNAERQMRWNWEYLQARLFRISIKNLNLEQTQGVGSSFINELKNILITVLAAKLVIDGEITLGMMMAITFIVGQLNSPIMQLIYFLRDAQDAKISLDRLAEIHNREEEEKPGHTKITNIQEQVDIKLNDLSFRYVGANKPVLTDLNLTIPANKVTAIVGVSGSGKTTLIKLLLKFYEPGQGEVFVGRDKLKNISQKAWRDHCGVVMQEGYIFNDTIAQNIAVGQDVIDPKRLDHAIEVANIKEFIEGLSLGYNTKIGMEGVGISTGQKQRLLIARAVYKNPRVLFFDEATSALDANNEKTIIENLDEFFTDKTVIVVAHRLSTVKNAHQIVVLDNGKIVEIGSHQELISRKGNYYNLVKNQLELGN